MVAVVDSGAGIMEADTWAAGEMVTEGDVVLLGPPQQSIDPRGGLLLLRVFCYYEKQAFVSMMMMTLEEGFVIWLL